MNEAQKVRLTPVQAARIRRWANMLLSRPDPTEQQAEARERALDEEDGREKPRQYLN